jgi:hypothetical protein
MIKKDPSTSVAEREVLLHEFDEVARHCLRGDPQATSFRTIGATFDPSTGAMRPRWDGLPVGRREDGNGAWWPERNQMIDLLARTWEVRSLRWNNLMRTITAPPADWVERLQRRWPDRFECEVSCGAGWADLITATTVCIDVVGEEFKYSQIKEKMGTLRLYYDGGGDTAFDLTTIAEHFISPRLCEVCGGLGHLVDGGWLRTLCDVHEFG